jgi:hypothetical protein
LGRPTPLIPSSPGSLGWEGRARSARTQEVIERPGGWPDDYIHYIYSTSLCDCPPMAIVWLSTPNPSTLAAPSPLYPFIFSPFLLLFHHSFFYPFIYYPFVFLPFTIVLDRRSRDLEVVIVRRAINLGIGNLQWGGNGEGLRKGRSVYK